MTFDFVDIKNSKAPEPIAFRATDAQTYAIEFTAHNAKEFENEFKKIALSLASHKYISEIHVKDFAENWLTPHGFTNRYGNGILLDLKKIDYSYYYERLVTKAKGSWVLNHHSLLPNTKPKVVD